MKRILVITGPTCTGKSGCAVRLAEKLEGEIVSADSMQVYKYMDIGSAKPKREELEKVPHHMIGVIDPRERFSAARYQGMARASVDDILSRGKLPVIAGGTGLYINSIICDMDFAAPPADPAYRGELEAMESDDLHRLLGKLDPEAALRIHPHNRRKLIRAVEAASAGSGVREFSLNRYEKYDPLIIGLIMERDELYERIGRRVDEMFANGLVDEVKGLMDMGLTAGDISMQGIGYKEVIGYINGEAGLEETAELIKKNTRHYAKRQFTWLKQYRDMRVFDVTSKDASEDILKWLKKRWSSTTRAINRTI